MGIFSRKYDPKKFWNWFAGLPPEFFDFEKDQARKLLQVERQLKKVDKNLVFDFSPPGEGDKLGSSATGGSFNPYALPPQPTITNQSGGYRSVNLSFNCSDGNGRPIDQTDLSKDSGGSVSGCQVIWSGDEAEGGTRKCATVRVHNAAGWSETSSQACATSDQKTVEVSVEGYPGNPPGPCTTNCDAIRLTIGGYKGSTTYAYTTNIVASDGSGAVSGSITTGGDGRATKFVAYYDRTVYDETYCVTLQDGRRACAQGR